MFQDGKKQIQGILELVNLCPEKLQEKCFEVLLGAYVASLSSPSTGDKDSHVTQKSASPSSTKNAASEGELSIPETVKTRLISTAARLGISKAKLAALFDFSVDPFAYHALAVPGENKKEKTKNVAFLLAIKSYISGGGWDADWKEFRAMCIDQNCFDKANNSATMKSDVFKTASPADGVILSSAGIKSAEALLVTIVGGSAE